MGQGQSSCMKYDKHYHRIEDHVGYALKHVHGIPKEHHHHFIDAGFTTDMAKHHIEKHYTGGGVQKLFVPSCHGDEHGCRREALKGHGITGFFGGGISKRTMNKKYAHYTKDHAMHNLVHLQLHKTMAYAPRRVDTHRFNLHKHATPHPEHTHPSKQDAWSRLMNVPPSSLPAPKRYYGLV